MPIHAKCADIILIKIILGDFMKPRFSDDPQKMLFALVGYIGGLLCIAIIVFCAVRHTQKKKAENTQIVLDLEAGAENIEEEALNDDWNADEHRGSAYAREELSGEVMQFGEIWGYVMAKREDEFDYSMPLTDIGYFSADVNSYGELSTLNRGDNFAAFSGRIHLVSTCESRALTHFVLDPAYSVRDRLVKSLIAASANYDGLQIDYELVPARDGKHFLEFLRLLKAGLGDKILSVAIPARVRTIKGDVYSYRALAAVVDRIIVMAYDEHWSTSEPGSIASIPWSRRVGEYSASVIPSEKLVMGLPFYGRTWGDFTTNKAYYFSGINRLLTENHIHTIERDDDVPYFSFKKEITITGYFEDEQSLLARTRLYKDLGIKNLAFWRVGQEDGEYWKWIFSENADVEPSEEE